MKTCPLPPLNEVAMIRQDPIDLKLSFYDGYDDLDSLFWARIEELEVTLVRHAGRPCPGTLIAFDPSVSFFRCTDLLLIVLDRLGLCNEDLIWINPETMPHAIDRWEEQRGKPCPLRELLN